ncbi:STAS domain-containing protein [Lentilitoribacter sp. EG35]|uniref:STAS domain-containing protein n=1 Tax=Lentilitoribacter sp. EG35 TaxID=3234192 RepID=UPI0034614A9B
MGDETSNILKLPENLDLNAASSMHEQLISLKGSSVEIDASDVRKSGAQCIQVLMAAKKTWDVEGNSIAVGAMSENFENTLKLLGISGDELPLKETA